MRKGTHSVVRRRDSYNDEILSGWTVFVPDAGSFENARRIVKDYNDRAYESHVSYWVGYDNWVERVKRYPHPFYRNEDDRPYCVCGRSSNHEFHLERDEWLYIIETKELRSHVDRHTF